MEVYDPTDPTGVDALPPNLLTHRNEKFAALLPLQGVDQQKFSWAYKYLCKHSFRLLGLPATVNISPAALASKMRNLLLNDENENIRNAANRLEIKGLVSSRPTEHTEAMVFFSFLIVNDLRMTDLSFARLVQKIRSNQLEVNGNVLRLVKQNGELPNQKPHDKILEFIPDMLQALAPRADEAELDVGIAEAPTPAPAPTAAPVTTANNLYATAIISVMADPTVIIPKPFGALENGIGSAILKPAEFDAVLESFNQKIQALLNLVSKKNAWHCKVTNDGAFVFAKTQDLLLGVGPDARVYLGLFLLHRSDQEKFDDDNREAIKAAVARGRPVAVKVFGQTNNEVEISLFRSLTREAVGLLRSIDVFEYEDTHCLVQDVALTTLKAWLNTNRSRCDVNKRFQLIRAACLALSELHGRSSGAIWHRNIHLSNFLISTDGSLKLGDFGFYRSFSSHQVDIRRLELQPVEIQLSIQEMLADTPADEPFPISIPGTERADIFMLGLALFEIFTGKKALSRADILKQKVVDLNPVYEVPSTGSDFFAHLLSKMLSHKEEERPTMKEVLNHPFFCSWNDHRNTLNGLYQPLHAGNQPVLNDTLLLLCDIFRSGEAEINTTEALNGLPTTVKARINVGKAPNVYDHKTKTLVPHPLPNTHKAVVWLRHFMTHFSDTATFHQIYNELAEWVFEGDVGAFIYRHPAVNWILPFIWDSKQKYQLTRQTVRDQIERDFEAARQKHDDDIERFNSDQRMANALFGV